MEFSYGLIAKGLQATVLPAGVDMNSLWVQYLGFAVLLIIGSFFFYFAFSGFSYFFFFRWKRALFYPDTLPEDLHDQIRTEVKIAITSMPIIALLMAPFSLMTYRGHSKMYHSIDEYGWPYLLLSIPLFLLVTDGMIYWIHRGLHLPFLYKYIHKPHHTYRFTTPFSSHAFHPLDGWAQGVPYYLFCFIFPVHHTVFHVLFIFVNFWTISIHDQVDFCGAGVLNSTGHHTIHHADFLFNYGQYFTLWDRLCNTYKPAAQTNELGTGTRLPHPPLNEIARAALKADKKPVRKTASSSPVRRQRTAKAHDGNTERSK